MLAMLLALPLAAQKPYRAPPLEPPAGPLKVYHLGHSLVGQDMPYMLAQLAGPGHRWNSQLGWGVTLKEHWEPDLEIRGFDDSNAAPVYRDAREAIGSGEYDAVVITEMVELRDAIRYYNSGRYVSRWADLARRASPDTVIYLYETWHPLDDPVPWQERIDRDLDSLWLGSVLGPDTRRNPDRPVYLVPGGQVLAAVVRAIEDGRVDGLSDRTELFARTESGEVDQIHINDLGAYIIALTHFAVLYQQSPVGLPHRLTRLDGEPFAALSDQAARVVQTIVRDTVRRLPRTGLAP